jgi:hypothetical protein
MWQSIVIYIPDIFFAFLGLLLVIQDTKENSVSLVLLVVTYIAWSSSIFFIWQATITRIAVSAIVLLIGALLLLILPGRLGEADVVFISGMALIFPYWSFMIALALGCVAGLAAFLWLSRGGNDKVFLTPIPLLPSLYWGGLTVILGGGLF